MSLGQTFPLRYATRITGRLGRSKNKLVRGAYGAARTAVRRVVNTVSPLQLGWVGALQTARWIDQTTFEISGWSFERGMDLQANPPVISARLHSFGQPNIPGTVTGYDEPLANTRMRDGRLNYTSAGFVARFDVSELIQRATTRPRTWRVLVDVRSGSTKASGGFTRRVQLGSANHLFARVFDAVQIAPLWVERRGLVLRAEQPAVVAASAQLDGRELVAQLRLNGIEFGSAALVTPQAQVALTGASVDGVVRVTGTLAPIDPHGLTSLSDPDEDEGIFSPELAAETTAVLSGRIVVTDAHGHPHEVATTLDPDSLEAAEALPFCYPGPDGTLRIRDTAVMMVVDEFSVEAEPKPTLRLRGRALGDLAGCTLALVGPRAIRDLTLDLHDDGSFEASGSLLASTWGQPDSPPPAGRYTVRGHTRDGLWFRVSAAIALTQDVPKVVDLDRFRAVIGVGEGRRPSIAVEALLRPKEIGAYRQEKLARRYQRATQPISEQFYFESFGGTQATCNPFALDRELAQRLPDAPRFWGVNDASVPVPDGAIQVVRGSEAWWKARQGSRFVITNEWLKNSYWHHPDQVVLQTWHGSMLKRIGLDRPSMDPLQRRVLLKERANWDFLLSQNAHSTEIFRSAYAWDKEIWQEGYPRNDALLTADRAAIRRSLGIPEDKIAVLYAPTWRENRTEMVTFLELSSLMEALGEDYLLLLRGHSRTLNAGVDVRLPGVLDVTSYPNVTDLFVAADTMITDYSSVMFDYSVTGRPMIFFVPDMDDYRDSLRGVYFDLSEVAPGPVLANQNEVVDAVRAIESSASTYAPAYRQWQARFNAHDDGESAKRVIDRLLALP